MGNSSLSRRQMIRLAGFAGASAMTQPFLSFTGHQQTMLKRAIPSTGEQLPVVGLGTWQQFDIGQTVAERTPRIEALRKMNEKGGKLIDSSPMYGRAEEAIGDLTVETGLSEKFFYATKVWTTGEENGIRQMQDSMRKMKRKTMDLMQIHNLTDWETHLRTLNNWKKEGKVRYTGVTHYTISSHARLEEIVKEKLVDFIQVNYSIRVRNAEKSLLKAAADKGVAVIINQPFESGSLFGLVRGKPLPAWAADYDISSWAQFFLKYILSNTSVTCVIPGASNPAYVADNMGAGYGKLPDEAGRKKMIALIETF